MHNIKDIRCVMKVPSGSIHLPGVHQCVSIILIGQIGENDSFQVPMYTVFTGKHQHNKPVHGFDHFTPCFHYT